jgi:signal transduction histidine kinase/CheY-like chemotaxis protein
MGSIKQFFNRLFNNGMDKAKSEADRPKVRYLNQGIICGTISYLPNLFLELVVGPLNATLLNVSFVLCSIIALVINSKGHYSYARSFILIALDVILLTACFTEGTQTGNHIIYPALILVYPTFIGNNDNKKEVLFLFAFTIVCTIIALTVCPEKGYLNNIDPKDAALMFKASYAVAFGLSAVLGYVIYILTLQREKELVKAKILAEQSATAKLQFISNMSHELRTPLNGIIGTTNLLQLASHSSEQQEQFELLKYSSSHMLQLVNDVLDFSKIDADKLALNNKPFELQNFVKNIYNSFAPQFEQKNLYFKLSVKDESLKYFVNGDDLRLSQILNNLLSNALKFTQHGGVTFTIVPTELPNKQIQILFEVADTGIGIKKESLNNVFESFIQGDLNTTRKYGGTGLGLTISKQLASLFNTNINAESEIGNGSRFWFAPIFDIAAEKPTTKTIVTQEFKSLAGMRILLAEDNNINMLIARKFLLKWGVALTEAKNGKQAIDICEEQEFDLLLFDLEMPEADGYTALTTIRQKNPEIPAIAFTAAIFDNLAAIISQKGFNDYVLKPFIPEELNAKLYAQKKILA